MRIPQHVLMGDLGRCAAEAFLYVRPGGDQWLVGDGAAVGFDHLNEECLAVGHPLHLGGAGAHAAASATAAAHDGVEARTPSILRVLPVVSPSQSSMPRSVVLVKVKRVASGLQRPGVSLALAGRSILTSVPSGILRRPRELLKVVLCSPVVLGLMRIPAMRSMSCASSAIGGVSDGLALHGEMAAGTDRQGGREG